MIMGKEEEGGKKVGVWVEGGGEESPCSQIYIYEMHGIYIP